MRRNIFFGFFARLMCRVRFALLKVFSQKKCPPKCLDLPCRHRRQKTCRDVNNNRRIFFAEKHCIKQNCQRQTRDRSQKIQKNIRFEMLLWRILPFCRFCIILQIIAALSAISFGRLFGFSAFWTEHIFLVESRESRVKSPESFILKF